MESDIVQLNSLATAKCNIVTDRNYKAELACSKTNIRKFWLHSNGRMTIKIPSQKLQHWKERKQEDDIWTKRSSIGWDVNAIWNHLLVGRDFSCDSFSSPILSFKPNFRSGIPERKHFIRIFPVTSQRRTLPAITKWFIFNQTEINKNTFQNQYQPCEDISRFTLSTMSRNTWNK